MPGIEILTDRANIKRNPAYYQNNSLVLGCGLSNHKIPADSAKWFIQQLVSMGMPIYYILKGIIFPEDWFKKKRALVTPAQYLKIIDNAINISGDPALGLKLGRKENLAEEGIWGYAILSSPTLGEANRVALQFWELQGSLVTLSYKKNTEFDRWTILPAFPQLKNRFWIFAVEELLSTFFSAAMLLSRDQFRYTKIHVSYPEPHHSHLYQDIFNCPVFYGQPECYFEVSSDYSNQPTCHAQPEIVSFCLEQCQNLLDELKGTDYLIDAIREIIVSVPGMSLRFNDVADQLVMSPRTLRRRLRERNQTYQQILDEVREKLAKEYLLTTNLSVDQIADRIGFSESPTFRRTFKKWTGMNISEFRKNIKNY